MPSRLSSYCLWLLAAMLLLAACQSADAQSLAELTQTEEPTARPRKTEGEVVIVADAAVLRSGPGTAFDEVGTVQRCTEVSVIAISGDEQWYELVSEAGSSSDSVWVSVQFVQFDEGEAIFGCGTNAPAKLETTDEPTQRSTVTASQPAPTPTASATRKSTYQPLVPTVALTATAIPPTSTPEPEFPQDEPTPTATPVSPVQPTATRAPTNTPVVINTVSKGTYEPWDPKPDTNTPIPTKTPTATVEVSPTDGTPGTPDGTATPAFTETPITPTLTYSFGPNLP